LIKIDKLDDLSKYLEEDPFGDEQNPDENED